MESAPVVPSGWRSYDGRMRPEHRDAAAPGLGH